MEVSSLKNNHITQSFGNSIMTLFFILSGFLITYLLVQEKKNTKTIDIKGFYIRRICRIWPLYYIILILGITIYVHVKWFQTSQTLAYIKDDYFIVVLLYFFHMSNFHLFFTSKIWALMYYWSLGVEEQFYAFWPWLVKKTNNYLKIFTTVLVIKIGLKFLIAISLILFSLTAKEIIILKKIENFLYLLRFESFAIGGIAALFLVEKKEKVLNFIYKPTIQWVNIGLLLLCIPAHHISDSIHLVYSVCFAIIILNVVSNPKAIFRLDTPYINYLGKISYGLYMYQIPLIVLIINFSKPYYVEENWIVWNLLVYFFCISSTILVSIFSYEFMEKRIIAFSKRVTLKN
jgi:peptidoglycan/LPS O-acetylase OafA/YrhL